MDIALHYGAMLRECIRHQSIARWQLLNWNTDLYFNTLFFYHALLRNQTSRQLYHKKNFYTHDEMLMQESV
jgi:hypothetical protein